MQQRLSFALTPCPNDTYVIGAIATGKLSLDDAAIDLSLHDIETLNRAALEGSFDVIKVSCATYALIAHEYAILDTGAALAEGFGPIVLSNDKLSRADLAQKNVVAPGRNTTAALLFRLWAGAAVPLSFVPYDEIIARVVSKEFDAGVIIHESRFTYLDEGLHTVVDLGAWWQSATGRPLALGCYVVRRSLLERFGADIDHLLRKSMDFALQGDADVSAYIRANAQEMDDDVIARHIDLYVNHYTRHLGKRGRDAIEYLASSCEQLPTTP